MKPFRSLILSAFLSVSLCAETVENDHRILYANLAGVAAIAAWGVAFWDYGDNPPHARSEGWFERDTKSGGADKLGHFYSAYLVGTGLSNLYESWGYDRNDAALYGSLSSFFLMNAMEVGDSFSEKLGFSYEDFILNTVGSAASYLFYTYPDLSAKVDFRVEYAPRFDTADILTDYERMKYLIALKADGFETITDPWLRYAEFHVGYYTRHYDDGYSDQSERMLYVGIGINLSRIIARNGYSKTARIFNYYQLPYTYVPLENDLNR